MVKNIICTVCPKGCHIKAECEGENIIDLIGYTCKRGKIYAEAECFNPVRTLTTTILTDKNSVVSVKTEKAVPKKMLAECMKVLNNITVKTPVNAGDVVVSDILGTGTDVIATASKF